MNEHAKNTKPRKVSAWDASGPDRGMTNKCSEISKTAHNFSEQKAIRARIYMLEQL
jgi:hypothetical protein